MTVSTMRIVTSLVGVLTLAGLWFNAFRFAEAVEPVRGRVEFERADVPADLPASWPKEIDRLVPVPRQEFVSLIEQLNARNLGPRTAWLKSAHYEATLVNDTLKGGLMTASVQRLEGRSSLLELGPFSFALESLKWQRRPAIWGSSADGRVWLVADEAQGELLGEWTCRGRKIPGGIDFDLQLPSATTTFLDLRAPRNFTLYAPNAEVSLLSETATDETNLWRIHCGGESHCRITFVAREGLESSRRVLTVEHDMQVVVREEDLRFQLNLYLEALDAPVQELSLKVPSGVVIYSAVYGVDTPVQIQKTPEMEMDGRLSIRLPSPLSGRRRALRIDGIAVHKPGQPTILPNIMIEKSLFDGGHLALTVQSPLEMRSMRLHGYRQRTTDGESLTFQQLTADAQLILDVHRAHISLSGQLLSLLDVEEDSWNLTSEIIWNSPTGGAYQANCLFPPEWEVTDVSLTGESESERKIDDPDNSQQMREAPKLNWDFQVQAGGASILAIEFLEPIQSGQMRSVNVLARRRPPSPGQTVPVPLPQLVNCDISEVILGVQVPSSINPVLSADSRLERIARPVSTVFKIPSEKSASERKWYRGDSQEFTGTLEIKPRLQPLHVRTETVVEALPAEYRVKYSIHYDHREQQADRLLVYLTESSPDVRWIWKGLQLIELSAAKLSKTQHIEWNLPAKGELWEIRLPRTTGQAALIEGITSNRWAITNRPALVFIPQAIEKLSELKLTQPDSIELILDTDGLKPTGQRLCWWYSTPQSEFGLSMRNPEPSKEFPLMVSMQLRTLISADRDGFDVYRARLQLENGSAQESLRIKLDSGAELQEAFVSGESIVATLQGGEFVIPGLSATRRDIVEINYRVPAHASLLRERRRIVTPHISAQVLGFFWEFSVPPSARIFSEPSGMCLSRSLSSPTWNERLFGPLGRTGSETIFHPLRRESWSLLFGMRTISESMTADPDGELVVRHSAAAPDVPAELSIELWHAARVHFLTWIILGLSLSIAVIIRMVRWNYRDRFAAYWLGLALAAACSVSAPYADFCGATIAGTLIGMLIPRHLLERRRATDNLKITTQRSPRGVVIAFFIGGLTFLGACLFAGTGSFAQEPAKEENKVNRRPVVFVAVDQNGNPSETLPFVYVPRENWARWKEMAGNQTGETNYLISSARYQMQLLNDGNLNLVAKYRVHVLGSRGNPVTVALALSDVSLPDSESCRVNGVPHAISALANGKGYSVELPRPAKAGSEISAESGLLGRADDEIETFEIELRSRKSRPQSTAVELFIPTVANSLLELSFPTLTPFVEISGSRGSSERRTDGRSITTDLGSTSTFGVIWGQSSPPQKPARVSASLLQHLELKAAYSEMTFHLVATIDEGSVDAMEFALPPNAVVRKVQSRGEGLLRSDVIIAKDGQRRLRLVFKKPQQTPIIVDGILVLLQSDSLVQTPLPKFGLVSSDTLQFQLERNWWGVSTSGDFRLDAVNLEPENVRTISTDAYLNAWSETVDPRHPESMISRQPQSTFEMLDGTVQTFTLVPYQPRRRAIQWKEIGVIGKRRLEWTLVGEIETSQAPTFQTVLLVDRRLRIEKISVMENDAERKTRWTESRTEPSRVVVFLSDKTQGRQIVTLRGSLPLTPGIPLVLPSIRAEDCEIPDARLVLARDKEVDVTFIPPQEWKKLTYDETVIPGSLPDTPIVLGQFQPGESGTRGTIQTSSRHSRCSTHAAVSMRRTESSGWQLKYRLEMTPEGDSPLRMGVRFPVSIADVNSVTVERAEPAWHDAHEGFRQLDLLLNRGEGPGSVVVQFDVNLMEPKQSEWELPLPIPMHSDNHETLFAVDRETVWFPTDSFEVRLADLPEWSTSFYEEMAGNELIFRVPDTLVKLQRDSVTSDNREPTVRLLDQRAWLHRGKINSGITQAFLSSVRNDLEFEIPPELSVTSVYLDDHPLALPTPSNGRMIIPMADSGKESLLTITWAVHNSGAGLRPSTTARFLIARGIRVERNLMTVLPEGPTRLWCPSGLTQVSSFEQGLERLETLLDRHAAMGDETRAAVANRWLIHQLQARIATHLPQEVERPSEDVLERLRRWNRLTEAINQLEPVPAALPVNWHARLLEGPVTESEAAIRGQGNENETIRFWHFDRRIVMGFCTGLLTLLLIPFMRRTIRSEWSEWLHRHVAVSWLLFAGFWWLFLTPSVFGPIVLIAGLISAALQYKTSESAST